MEVHHHAHPSTSSGHRKKWTHYFWEFLMLFLAVFCGFLAEYKLEMTIEHHREKVYIESMIEDLQNDTTKLANNNKSLLSINNSIDSILIYFDDLPQGANPALFRNLRAIYGYNVFFYSDRTIQQLKNSGGLRLIKNKKSVNGIMDYDASIRGYEDNGEYLERYWENLNNQRIQIIDRQTLDSDLKTLGHPDNKKNYLLVNDPLLLSKLKSFIYELKLYHSSTISHNNNLRKKAVGLMETLQKEYHLK